MVDLRKFYLKSIKNEDYYFKFYELLSENITSEYFIYDELEAIDYFKELCNPYNDGLLNGDPRWFYFLGYYLNSRGYYIKQFPNVLRRPPKKPYDFAFVEIREKLMYMGKGLNGIIQYSVRREFINSFEFVKKPSCLLIDDEIDLLIQSVSTRNSSFYEMSNDEKLESISNAIENLLKIDGKFIDINFSNIGFDFISYENVKKYRKKMQCFRHASEEALLERKSYSKEQKEFLTDYGIIIIKTIYNFKKTI